MKPRNGFTLIELLVVVAIIGILAVIAYPSYTHYVIRAHRSAAESFMMSVANKQEQYMLDARQYATSLAALAVAPPEVASYYTVTVAADNGATPPTYTITAARTPAQNDTQCGDLTLNESGAKGSQFGTVADCW